MPSVIPAQGIVSYNGVVFGPETETLDYSVKPIMDSARRTVKCVEYSLKLKTIIAVKSGDLATSTDLTLTSMRTLLTQNGGQLYYYNKGFGNITINVAGGQRDVNWGPITTLIGFKPIGCNQAAEVIWGVTYQTLDCTNALFAFGVMEFNWKMEYTLARDRMTNRVCSGFLQIPETLIAAGANQLTDTADLYYELCRVEIPYGHRRENEKRTINEAKTRLDFSFTDMQLKSPLPWGVIEMTDDHEQRNEPPVQFYKKVGRVSATYEMALHVPMNVAEMHFHRLWLDRRAAMLLSVNGGRGNFFIPQVLSFRESITRRTVTGSLTYLFIQGRPVNAGVIGGIGVAGVAGKPVLGTQGFWRPVIDGKLNQGQPTNNPQAAAEHTQWAASMEYATVLRGYTQDIIQPTDDIIINLCKSGPPQTLADSFISSVEPFTTDPQDTLEDIPEPEDSWVDWYCRIFVSTDEGVVIQRPLPKSLAPDPNTTQPSLIDQLQNGDGFQAVPQGETPTGNDPPVRVQRRTAPVVYVWIVGYATRMAYQIGEPAVESVGGIPVYPANRTEVEYFATSQVGSYGLPAFEAEWCRRYVLMGTPQLPAIAPNGPFDLAEPTTSDPTQLGSV